MTIGVINLETSKSYVMKTEKVLRDGKMYIVPRWKDSDNFWF
jgi:hypothetical protein